MSELVSEARYAQLDADVTVPEEGAKAVVTEEE